MHSAPAVTHPTGRTPRLALLLAGLCVLAGAGAVGVLASGQAQPLAAWKIAAWLATMALTVGGVLQFWRAQRARGLAWDGAQWRLAEADAAPADGAVVQVQVRLDAQSMLLLCANHPETGRRTWLWAQKGADAGRWHLLRCAVWALQPQPDAVPAQAAQA